MKNKINDALVNECADTIKRTEQDNIINMVYDSFEPSDYYDRRGMYGGGLNDIDNMEATLTESGTLTVSNNTPFNPIERWDGGYYDNAFPDDYSLAYVVEHGNNGLIPSPAKPFTKATVDELNKTKAHVEAMKRGLRKHGLTVK